MEKLAQLKHNVMVTRMDYEYDFTNGLMKHVRAVCFVNAMHEYMKVANPKYDISDELFIEMKTDEPSFAKMLKLALEYQI